MEFVAGKKYKIVNRDSKRVLADSGGKLIVYDGPDQPDQYWFVLDFGAQGYRLMNAVHLGAIIADSGGNPIAYQGPDQPDQYWNIYLDGDNYILRCRSSGNALADVNGLRVSPASGGVQSNQHWLFV